MKRICPTCGYPVRTIAATRKTKMGDLTCYVYCDTCVKRYHVYLNQEGKIDGIVERYSRKSSSDIKYERACREAVKNIKHVPKFNLYHKEHKDFEDFDKDINSILHSDLTVEQHNEILDILRSEV